MMSGALSGDDPAPPELNPFIPRRADLFITSPVASIAGYTPPPRSQEGFVVRAIG